MTDREGVFPMQPGIYIVGAPPTGAKMVIHSSTHALKDDKGKDHGEGRSHLQESR